MSDVSEFDYEGYGRLPQHVIRQAAAEYIVKYLTPQLERFFGFAVDALAHDCEISNEEAEAILTERFKSMARGLKQGQYTINHAAIFYCLWGLFDEKQDERMFEINENMAKYWRMDMLNEDEQDEDEL